MNQIWITTLKEWAIVLISLLGLTGIFIRRKNLSDRKKVESETMGQDLTNIKLLSTQLEEAFKTVYDLRNANTVLIKANTDVISINQSLIKKIDDLESDLLDMRVQINIYKTMFPSITNF